MINKYMLMFNKIEINLKLQQELFPCRYFAIEFKDVNSWIVRWTKNLTYILLV